MAQSLRNLKIQHDLAQLRHLGPVSPEIQNGLRLLEETKVGSFG